MNAIASPALRVVRRALLSVSDKSGIVDLARELRARGVELLSTGGTYKLLADAGIDATEVSRHTGFPEIMDGRVKTLHPKIHGGILGRRGIDDDVMNQHQIAPIDLVVLNLYPFEQTVAREGFTHADAVENIDIGGPAMLRAAAKNHHDVAVVVDPSDYAKLLAALDAGGTTLLQREQLATKAYSLTARYDAAVAGYFSSRIENSDALSHFPGTLGLQFHKQQDLRYGENPHQQAAFYAEREPAPGTIGAARQLQGKELSYNNIADADAAWECVKGFPETACVIVKHANPCGVAVGKDVLEAYSKALKTDPTSAFGGIIAFNRIVDGAAAQAAAKQFVEVLMAPGFTEEALAAFKTKVNVRILQIAMPPGGASDWETIVANHAFLSLPTRATIGINDLGPKVLIEVVVTATRLMNSNAARIIPASTATVPAARSSPARRPRRRSRGSRSRCAPRARPSTSSRASSRRCTPTPRR